MADWKIVETAYELCRQLLKSGKPPSSEVGKLLLDFMNNKKNMDIVDKYAVFMQAPAPKVNYNVSKESAKKNLNIWLNNGGEFDSTLNPMMNTVYDFWAFCNDPASNISQLQLQFEMNRTNSTAEAIKVFFTNPFNLPWLNSLDGTPPTVYSVLENDYEKAGNCFNAWYSLYKKTSDYNIHSQEYIEANAALRTLSAWYTQVTIA